MGVPDLFHGEKIQTCNGPGFQKNDFDNFADFGVGGVRVPVKRIDLAISRRSLKLIVQTTLFNLSC